jgi:hypothetical protein
VAQHIPGFGFYQFPCFGDLGFGGVFGFNLRPFFWGFILKEE